MSFQTSTIGFPRIGPNREIKKALERYWKKSITAEDLLSISAEVEAEAWKLQADSGIDLIGLDGTLYDQMLDTTFFLGLAPERFSHLSGYDQYFAMARGAAPCCGSQGNCGALDMSKFFDTNYHYLVPELTDASTPSANFSQVVDRLARGQQAIGQDKAVPIIIGPNTFVRLSTKTGVSQSDMVHRLVPVYRQLLQHFKDSGVPQVQIHEPALTLSDASSLRNDFEFCYAELSSVGVPVNLVTYYDDIGDTYPWVVQLPVAAISLDFLGVPGSQQAPISLGLISRHGFPEDKSLGAGVVDGRSIWADEGRALGILKRIVECGVKRLVVQSSASLQHVPYDLEVEKKLPAGLRPRLAFAVQKLREMVQVAHALKAGGDALSAAKPPAAPLDLTTEVGRDMFDRPEEYSVRRGKQLTTPPFPTTTIGSFPQTQDIRRLRLQLKKGDLGEAEYVAAIDSHIAFAIGVQEGLELDVLVHGEAERTDMVEYFGEKLDGFAFTTGGWVQSYGSRYVRPPIIHDDVSRPAAMTVREYLVAQSFTKKPVKGMLTGPVTILNWSFPRKDISRKSQAFQIALALRQEVDDLQKAGCAIVQVDEPALREGLPLKRERWDAYLKWAVDAFRLTCAVANPHTQIVTHLCYSDFQDIMKAIDDMDADVLTIENSRSSNEMIKSLSGFNYRRDIGPGVYDVHSPVVPSVQFLEGKVESFLATGILGGDYSRIWLNPDCGLKTREWSQVIPSLRNMVEVAKLMRQKAAPGGKDTQS